MIVRVPFPPFLRPLLVAIFSWIPSPAAAGPATHQAEKVSLHTSANFAVEYVRAEDLDKARKYAETAEAARVASAIFWTGKPLPQWAKPARIRVQARTDLESGGGVTTFGMFNNEVFDFRILLIGTTEQMLHSVLPHEVDHAVRASLVRRPIPRWMDEGSAGLFEVATDHQRLRTIAAQAIARGDEQVLFADLNSKQYPKESDKLLALYGCGFSLVEFLLSEKPQSVLLKLQSQAARSLAPNSSWAAIKDLYGFETVIQLRRAWLNWFETKRVQSTKNPYACKAFDCQFHGSAKQTATPPARPKLYCFTQPNCSGCLRFARDVDAGLFAAFDVRFIKRSAETGWLFGVEGEAVYARVVKATGGKLNVNSKKTGVPLFWVEGSPKARIGYPDATGRKGFIDSLVTEIRNLISPRTFNKPPTEATELIQDLGAASSLPPAAAFVSSVQEAEAVAWGDVTLVVCIGSVSDTLPAFRKEIVERVRSKIETAVREKTGGKLHLQILAEVEDPLRFNSFVVGTGLSMNRLVQAAAFVRRQEVGLVKGLLRDRLIDLLETKTDSLLENAPVLVVSETADSSRYHAGLSILATRPQPYERDPATEETDGQGDEPGKVGTAIDLVRELRSEIAAARERANDDNPDNDPPVNPVIAGVVALVTRRFKTAELFAFLYRKLKG